jgi:hypothetical protein
MGLADPLGHTFQTWWAFSDGLGLSIGHSLREMGPLSARKESPDGRVLARKYANA